MNDPVAELVRLFAKLPGIGERSAQRLVFHVLGAERDYAHALGRALSEVHDRVRRCVRCGNYGAEEICAICADPRRDATQLCVVARVQDLVAIERSGTFRGRYHVLHALLAPLDGMGPDRIPLDALRDRVHADAVKEVVIATPLSVEGEATALYVAQALRATSARVSRIASGVPHGGELEFTDLVTLGRAFEGRREI